MAQPKPTADQLNLTNANLTGDPIATSPSAGDNDTSIATTAFVKAQNYVGQNSPSFTGNPTAPTQTPGNDSTRLATTAFVQDAVLTGGAGASFGAVGTYVMAYYNFTGFVAILPEGSVVAGSLLLPTNNFALHNGTPLSGSWRLMGYLYLYSAQQDASSIWLRIS